MTIDAAGTWPEAWRHDVFPQDFAGIPILRRMRFSSALRARLAQAASSASVIHAHGLWLMANVYPAHAAARARKPLVLSPRGMLGEAALRFSAGKKRLFWLLAQERAVREVACIHATSEQEYNDIRKFGLKAPVAIIPNGVDIPPATPTRSQDRDLRTILFLGRLHPKKGVGQLIEAWLRIAERHPQWRLEIVGPLDGSYASELARVAAAVPRVRLAGPLYGAEKERAYREADLFVLPTLNDNFAMTVAEALAQATPVVSTKGAPWAGLTTHDCGWWIDHGVDALAATLKEAMSLPPERLAAMGAAGRQWMAREFDWSTVATSMEALYLWLNSVGPKPTFVIDA